MAYFPNASAGEVFEAQCLNCPLGYGWNDPNQGELFDSEREQKSCPVALIQLQFNYSQLDNKRLRQAMTILVSESGECKVRSLLVECRAEGP